MIAFKINDSLSKEELINRIIKSNSKKFKQYLEKESLIILLSEIKNKSFVNSFYYSNENIILISTYGKKISRKVIIKNAKSICKILKIKKYQIVKSFSKTKKLLEKNSIPVNEIQYLPIEEKGKKKHSNILVTIIKFPFIIIFKILFFALSLIFSGSTEKKKEIISNDSVESFYDKKKRGYFTNYYGIRVSGGLLPKQYTSDGIEYHFDGSSPFRIGTRGGKFVVETDGNLQVFYRNRNDIEKMEYIAKSVDYYQMK